MKATQADAIAFGLPKSSALSSATLSSSSTQTLSTIRIQGNKSTQTELPNVIIASVVTSDCHLPLVQIKIKKFTFNLLIDSGSSISLFDHTLFNSIKADIPYHPLSRQVNIVTINSSVQFSGSVEFGFKIDKHHFKQTFYLTPLNPQSQFVGILGFDFIQKFNIILHPKEKFLMYHNCKIDLLNPAQELSVDSRDTIEKVNHNTSMSNDKISKSATSQTSLTNIPLSSNKQSVVKLSHKVLIPAHGSMFLDVSTEDLGEISHFLFQPFSINPLLSIQPSIHVTPSQKSHIVKFQIFASSSAYHELHLNKSCIVGTTELIEAPNENVNDNNDADNSTDTLTQCVNFITPSPEILDKRKSQLSSTDFKLDHLNSKQKDKILHLLMSNSAAFSKSLETLGHTDRVQPQLEFTSEYPRKVLPLPIPHYLQNEALSQINELLASRYNSKIRHSMELSHVIS